MFATRLLLLQFICLTICLAKIDYNTHVHLHPVKETPVITMRYVALPPGYIRYPEIGSAYRIFPRLVKWAKARKACSSGGGRLAVIDTTEKVEYLRSQRTGIAHIWVGIFRDEKDGNWTAVDNSQIAEFLPWRHVYRGASRNCLTVSGVTPGLSNWPCIQRMKYACEIPDAV